MGDALRATLRTERLEAGFSGRAVVRGVEVEIEAGQVLCIVGPNGSGKSTILKSISRQIEPVAGKVFLDGSDVARMPASELARKMAVMLTGHLRTEMLTCLDVVETGRYPFTGRLGILAEEDRLLVREAMETVGAWELRDRDFMQVSDGQRQRVLLARAIAQEPGVMVLDEPTSYLDVRYQLDLLDVLRRLARERGTAVVLTLHELSHIQRVADTVLCIRDGGVFAYGSPEEVLTGEAVAELFDLGGGTYNPCFCSVEDAPLPGTPRVFVLAGAGTGAAAMRALRRAQVSFAAGILPENDADCLLARALTPHVCLVGAFCAVDSGAVEEAVEVLRGCEALVDCLDGAYGPQNELVRLLPEEASKLGIPVFPNAASYLAANGEGGPR